MVTDSVLELRTKFRWSLTGTPLQVSKRPIFFFWFTSDSVQILNVCLLEQYLRIVPYLRVPEHQHPF